MGWRRSVPLAVAMSACGGAVAAGGPGSTSTGSDDPSTTEVGSGPADDSTTASPVRETETDADPGDGRSHRFVDATHAAGLSQVLQVAERGAPFCLVDRVTTVTPGDYCVPERLIAGVAVGDLDGDGDGDLVFPSPDGATQVFLAGPDGRFDPAMAGFDPLHRAAGAAIGDVDRDGDLDVYLAGFTTLRNYLYLNRGDATFVERAVERGAAVASDAVHLGTTPAFGDVDNDGDLDLFVGEWRPDEELGGPQRHVALLRNLGPQAPGTFEDVTTAAGIELAALEPPGGRRPGVFAFAPAFVDFDGDALPDLAIAGDFHTTKLYRNVGDFRFEDRTAETGVGNVFNGMGSAIGDLDGDGALDWFVTAIASGNAPTLGNRLYLGHGDGTFTDATDAWGVLDGGWGWGAVMIDHDNDGVLGLAMTAGWTQMAFADDRLTLWDKPSEGPMVDVAAELGLIDAVQGRGLVAFDYEDDGDQDLLVSHWAGPPTLWRNDDPPGDWLRVRLRGTVGDLEGRHATVRLEMEDGSTRVVQVGAGSHLYGHGESTAHFGLGDRVSERVPERVPERVVVDWPVSGQRSSVAVHQTRTTLVIEEPRP